MQPSPAPREHAAPVLAHSEPQDALLATSQAELVRALAADDERRALLAAETLWRCSSLENVYDVISRQLAMSSVQVAQGRASLATSQALTVAVLRLVGRLRPLPPTQPRGTVLLANPEGDGHFLALYALAHLVEDMGYRAVIGAGLPWVDLAELAGSSGDLLALCLSLHAPVQVAPAQRGIAAVRKACGGLPVLIGGPQVAADPALARKLGADAGTTGGSQELRHLDGWASGLSDREREVLELVSMGLTNAEVAERLFVGAATVKSHLDHIFVKTGTTQRAAAVAAGLRNGWFR